MLLRLLGGGDKKRIRRLLAENQIDTSHWPPYSGRPIEVYLSNQYPLASDNLKKRLFREGLKSPVCERCGNDRWQGEPIPIELHHVDGNHNNNELKNLQVLCRNCHGLAPNHKGAATRKRTVKVSRQMYIEAIPQCTSPSDVCRRLGLAPKGRNYDTIHGIMAKEGLVFRSTDEPDTSRDLGDVHIRISPKERSVRAMTPEAKEYLRSLDKPIYGNRAAAAVASRKVVWPSKEELTILVWSKSIENIAKDYGVNGNSVRRWAKRYGVALPPIGYWVRRHAGYTHEQALVSQKRIRKPLHRPTAEQAQLAYEVFKTKGSLRQAGLAIGFNHEVTRDAMIRFGLLSSTFRGRRGRPVKMAESHGAAP